MTKPASSEARTLSGAPGRDGMNMRSIMTSNTPTSPSMASVEIVRRRVMTPVGPSSSRSRTRGPASFWIRGATLGPTPLRVVTSANRGKRIWGRIVRQHSWRARPWNAI